MKRNIVLLLLSGSVVGASPTLPVFEEKLERLSDLSLSGVAELVREGAPLPTPAISHVPTARSRTVSRMPIVRPEESVDWKLRIVEPDSSKDYTLIVKTPEIDLED